jgi:DNA-binding transcriptional MerR regulator
MTSTRPPGDRPLMTAGRFAEATLLSAKALRIYADRGLLPPRFVDPANGYRYYADDQVRTGWLIVLLRSAQLSLEEIAEVNLAVLARARHHLEGESTMTDLSTRVESDRAVLSVLRRMRPDEMDEVISGEAVRLREIARGAGLTVTGDAFGIFHAPVTEESDGPLEIAVPVDGLLAVDAVPSEGDVRSYRLAGGHVAERHAEGRETDFPEILALYDEVHSWITESGRTPVGPPREIWHNAPRDPEPLRLTISWPYATV